MNVKEILCQAKVNNPRIRKLEIPSIITPQDIDNYWPRTRLLELGSEKRDSLPRNLHELNKRGYTHDESGLLGLIPIHIGQYYENIDREIPQYLLHDGVLTSSDISASQTLGEGDELGFFDNVQQMINLGIFGNPNPKRVTCLKPPYSRVAGMDRNARGVSLTVDPSCVTLFVDPEMDIDQTRWPKNDFPEAVYDIPGNALMVFGGIPVHAILSIALISINTYKGIDK